MSIGFLFFSREDSLINYIEGKNVQPRGPGRPQAQGTPFSLGVKETDSVSEVKRGQVPACLCCSGSTIPDPDSFFRIQVPACFFESLHTQAVAISTQRRENLAVSHPYLSVTPSPLPVSHPVLKLHHSQGSQLKYTSPSCTWTTGDAFPVTSSHGVGEAGTSILLS